MKITVTRAHIDDGKPGDPDADPVALAIRERLPGARVGLAVVEIGKREHPLPRTAIRFVWDFDAGRPVEPFSFEFETEWLLTGLRTAQHRDGRRIAARDRAALLTAINRLSAG